MQKNVWMRFAVNGPKIREGGEGSLLGWRCYIDGSMEQTPLKGWGPLAEGGQSPKNFITRIDANEDKHGLIAWIDVFGSYLIKDDFLYITFAEPEEGNVPQ